MLTQQKPRRHEYVGIIIDNQNGGMRCHARTVAPEVFEIDHLFAISDTFDETNVRKPLISLGADLARALLLLGHDYRKF